MNYVIGVLEPATKTVVTSVSGIVEPATATLRRIIQGTGKRLQGGARAVIMPAAEGFGAAAAPAMNEVIFLAVEAVRMIWRQSFEPLGVEHMELHFMDPLLT